MVKKVRIFGYLLIMGLLVISFSCSKEDDDPNQRTPILSTFKVTDIAQTTAKIGGIITSDEGFFVTARGVCWSTSENPTISENKTSDGKGAGIFTSEITGLTKGTTYYVRAYATNSQGTGYSSTLVFETLGDTFTDARDFNVYKIVTIGNQLWMAENLKYLPRVIGSTISSTTYPYYYVYGFTGTSIISAKANTNYKTYGVLYNWAAAMNGATSSISNPSGVQGVCPTGWHLPSDAEWTQLIDYLGGVSVAGGKLKETGTTHWLSPNTGATNETGFTALPGGFLFEGTLYAIGGNGGWWSATEHDATKAWYQYSYYNGTQVVSYTDNKNSGFSIRCVKD